MSLSIEGYDVQFEIDTGSAISAIPWQFYEEKLADMKLLPIAITLKAYDGKEIETSGYINAKIEYQGKKFNVPFVVIRSGCRPLIGRDIFKLLRFKIDTTSCEMHGISECPGLPDSLGKVTKEFQGFF